MINGESAEGSHLLDTLLYDEGLAQGSGPLDLPPIWQTSQVTWRTQLVLGTTPLRRSSRRTWSTP
jgi:hypothetical protein